MNSSSNNIKFLNNKVEPTNTFWNWNHDPKSNTKFKKWRLDEKRFSPNELFTTYRPKTEPETLVLGPGAGAGVGCGVGVGFGLVGGAGFSGWPWNHLRLAFGFGVGCGVGVGFGLGNGFGRGSSWESIKSDVLGFKKEKDPSNRVVTYI